MMGNIESETRNKSVEYQALDQKTDHTDEISASLTLLFMKRIHTLVAEMLHTSRENFHASKLRQEVSGAKTCTCRL